MERPAAKRRFMTPSLFSHSSYLASAAGVVPQGRSRNQQSGARLAVPSFHPCWGGRAMKTTRGALPLTQRLLALLVPLLVLTLAGRPVAAREAGQKPSKPVKIDPQADQLLH